MVAAFKVLQNKDQLQNQTVSVGGDYTPPAAGLAKLRFVGYVEVGKHRKVFKGAESFKPLVKLLFEIHGKKWEPKDIDGKKVPQRITITTTHSTSSKAGFYKLFLKMRDGREEITHMAEMLGEGFMGKIVHREYTQQVDGKEVKKIAAELQDSEKAWTITPPYVDVAVMDDDNEPTGEYERRPQSVPPALGDLRLFIWDLADKEQWDSLHIEGADADKQFLQLEVVKAKNFIGSAAEAVAAGSDKLLELAKKGVNTANAENGDSGDSSDDDDGEGEKAGNKPKADKKPTKKPDADTDAADLSDID